ncbi:hypothetical protein HPB52_021207 [Rhipicephalus sanguineus]|uniref:Uncharacterized protein n=1 Tax=Rhipicephalus sanguineus TaxID=34632 RepID=A0A9D4Q2T9_RHISA|nr:hypothetical protein HPB52_021207 [Rhipicephalus sanguineus]
MALTAPVSGKHVCTNPIWNFFLKVPAGGEAQCETCGVVLKCCFIEMMGCAIPEYVVPSRKTFSRTVIPNLYVAKRDELKKHVRAVFDAGDAECLTLPTDTWTSRASDGYVCVTAHMMDRDFTQHACALACKPMPQGHTGQNLVQFLQDVIEEWGLPDNIPTFVITNNGRNFVSAVAKSNWSGLRCFAQPCSCA